MKAIKISEANFSKNESIDFTKNKKLMFVINLLSVLSFPLFYLIFYYMAKILSLNTTGNILHYYESFRILPFISLLIFVITILLVFLIHELIHGMFFYLFTGEKPVFGYKIIYAYAGAPNWYIKKNYFHIVSISPFILITAAGFITFIFIPENYSSVVFLLVTAHAAACMGDIWVSLKLLKKPKETYINDSGLNSVISY
jgi:hypothetical protein